MQPLPSRIIDTDLKMGSITEVWKNGHEWSKYVQFLDKCQPEGYDSANQPLKMSRYAKFLQLYVQLHYQEMQLKSDPRSSEILKSLVYELKNEGFFDAETCLSCIDAGQRDQIMVNFKNVKKGSAKAGAWVFQPAYSPVLDKLNSMLGIYYKSA